MASTFFLPGAVRWQPSKIARKLTVEATPLTEKIHHNTESVTREFIETGRTQCIKPTCSNILSIKSIKSVKSNPIQSNRI